MELKGINSIDLPSAIGAELWHAHMDDVLETFHEQELTQKESILLQQRQHPQSKKRF